MDVYRIFVDYYTDKRTINYPLWGSPVPVLTIVTIYWLFIKVVGVEYMRKRPPYDLTRVIQFYNLFQVALSTCLFISAIHCLRALESWRCVHFYSYGEQEANILFLSWLYYINKYLDLLDTVFFVLRKKFQLITPLHTYHHILMVLGGWLYGRFFPVGELSMVGLLNSFVHIFMYYYYYIKISKKSQVDDVWWKKHITQLQLLQFALLLMFYAFKLSIKNCSYPKGLLLLGISQVLVMIVMFGQYYYRAFVRTKPSKKVQ